MYNTIQQNIFTGQNFCPTYFTETLILVKFKMRNHKYAILLHSAVTTRSTVHNVTRPGPFHMHLGGWVTRLAL